MPSQNHNKDQLFKALELKNAFIAGLSIIGRASMEILIEELKRMGIDLDNDNRSYSLVDLERVLSVVLGDDAAPLMIDRIIVQLRNRNR